MVILVSQNYMYWYGYTKKVHRNINRVFNKNVLVEEDRGVDVF